MSVNGFDLFDLSGALGVACYIGSYLGLQLGLLRGAGYAHTSLNLAASSLVLTSLVANFNLYSAIIQLTWIAISLLGLTRLYLLSRAARLGPEERAFHEAMFPEMDPRAAGRLIRSGRWRDAAAGEVLVTEGRPVRALVFLASGAVAVTLRGSHLATIERPTFIGEMGALSGLPATATVTLREPARIWEHSSEELARLLANPNLRLQVEGALARDARRKLLAANDRTAGLTAAS